MGHDLVVSMADGISKSDCVLALISPDYERSRQCESGCGGRLRACVHSLADCRRGPALTLTLAATARSNTRHV